MQRVQLPPGAGGDAPHAPGVQNKNGFTQEEQDVEPGHPNRGASFLTASHGRENDSNYQCSVAV